MRSSNWFSSVVDAYDTTPMRPPYNVPSNDFPPFNDQPQGDVTSPGGAPSKPLKPVRLGPPIAPGATPPPPYQWGGFPLLPTRPPMDFQFAFSAGPPTTSGPDWVNVPVNQQPYFPPQQQAAGGAGMGGGSMGGIAGMGGAGMGMHRPLHGK